MNKGKHYYNNGVEERVFGIDKKILNRWILGRLSNSNYVRE